MIRTLARTTFWAAAIIATVLAVIAVGWALATVWPAYLLGAALFVAWLLSERRRRVLARRTH